MNLYIYHVHSLCPEEEISIFADSEEEARRVLKKDISSFITKRIIDSNTDFDENDYYLRHRIAEEKELSEIRVNDAELKDIYEIKKGIVDCYEAGD